MSDASEPAGGSFLLTVNGVEHRVDGSRADDVLAVFLREHLGHVDVKLGCGEGACGACSVLLDAEEVPSCLVMVGRARERIVRTPADLAADELGSRIVGELARHGALQCGFCTPGFVCAAYGLAQQRADLAEPVSREQVAGALEGHLCRCTGYERILAAVQRAVSVPPLGGRQCA